MALLLLAGAARLPGLGAVPPGLHFDEAYNALDALRVLAGERPLFFEGNFGREPLFHYLCALSISLLGATPEAVRGVSAVAGTLAVPLTYGIGRLLVPRGLGPALAAAAVQALLPWDLHFSRYGIRAELLPLLGSAAVFCLLLGRRSGRRRWYVAAGAMLGLSLYGYMAARLLPLVFLGWALLALRRAERGRRCALLADLSLAAVVALVVFAPLGLHFLRHPDQFGLRAGQVALHGDAVALGRQFLANLGAWALALPVSGDTNPHSNLPGAPALTPWLVLPWLVGLGASLRRIGRPEWGLLPVWFGVMLLPSLLSDHAPSFQRAIGAVPPLALTVGLGVWLLARRLAAQTRRPAIGAAVAALLIAAAGVQGLHQYFVTWGRSNALYYAFDEGIYAIGEHMRDAAAAGHRVYLSPVRPDHATLRLLLREGGEPATFDGRTAFVAAPLDGRPTEYIFLAHEDQVGPRLAFYSYADLEPVATYRDREGQAYALAFRTEGSARRRAGAPSLLRGHWEEGPTLDGLFPVSCDDHGRCLSFAAVWRTGQAIERDYTWFVQLIGPPNPESGTRLWSGADAMPGRGTYTTSRWRPGERVIDFRTLRIPERLADGDYYLAVGWYLLESGERLRLTWPDEGDALLLGPFHVRDNRVVRPGPAALVLHAINTRR